MLPRNRLAEHLTALSVWLPFSFQHQYLNTNCRSILVVVNIDEFAKLMPKYVYCYTPQGLAVRYFISFPMR